MAVKKAECTGRDSRRGGSTSGRGALSCASPATCTSSIQLYANLLDSDRLVVFEALGLAVYLTDSRVSVVREARQNLHIPPAHSLLDPLVGIIFILLKDFDDVLVKNMHVPVVRVF